MSSSDDEEGEVSHPLVVHSLSDEAKDKLQDMRSALQEDIGHLVDNAELVRWILNDVRGRIPEHVEEILTPTAFIETRRIPVTKALRNKALRTKLERTRQEEASARHQAKELNEQIKSLESSRPDMTEIISRLR